MHVASAFPRPIRFSLHPHEPLIDPTFPHNDDWYHKARIEYGLYMEDRYNANDECKKAFRKRMVQQSVVVITFKLKSVLCMDFGYLTLGA